MSGSEVGRAPAEPTDVADAAGVEPADVAVACPHCGSPVAPGDAFCEQCGGDLVPSARAGAADGPAPQGPAPAGSRGLPPPPRPGVLVVDADLGAAPTTCAACGGAIAPDGYCSDCGTPAARPRDHWVDRPAARVVLVCDRGVRHSRNEDAGAVAATPDPGPGEVPDAGGDANADGGGAALAVLVVCDGVSSATDSDVASLAAARVARDVLAALPPPQPPEAVEGPGGDAPGGPRAGVLVAALRRATEAANRAATGAARDPREPSPPSCTFVACVLEGDLLVTGWVGDSRAYWLPDARSGEPPEAGEPVQLSVDDSWATEAVAAGMTREEAEAGPHAHAITRWLGVDAPDPVPRTDVRRVTGPGWLLVCSDGLWNYCSPAGELQALVGGTVADVGADPLAVAEQLVAWANGRGGHDNITVALARL